MPTQEVSLQFIFLFHALFCSDLTMSWEACLRVSWKGVHTMETKAYWALATALRWETVCIRRSVGFHG